MFFTTKPKQDVFIPAIIITAVLSVKFFKTSSEIFIDFFGGGWL